MLNPRVELRPFVDHVSTCIKVSDELFLNDCVVTSFFSG